MTVTMSEDQPRRVNNDVVDNVILQVFEDCDENSALFYPVTTQKQARAFVKALYARGVAYRTMCDEILEPEQSFTSWRTGIGRAGIGHRVIERINRPISELLMLADDLDFDDVDAFIDQPTSSLPAAELGNGTKITAKSSSTASVELTNAAGSEGNGASGRQAERALPLQVSAEPSASERRFDDELILGGTSISGDDATIELVSSIVDTATTLSSPVGSDKLASVDVNGTNNGSAQDAVDCSNSMQPASSNLDVGEKPVNDDAPCDDGLPLKQRRMDAETDAADGELLLDSQAMDIIVESAQPVTECNVTLASIETLSDSDDDEDMTSSSSDDVIQSKAASESLHASAPIRAVDVNEVRSVKLEHHKVIEASLTNGNELSTLNGNTSKQHIDENYNSDDEADDEQDEIETSTFQSAVSARSGESFKGKGDGAGFVYVFTDTATSESLPVTEYRVKIGSSRHPYSRLRQASLFNVDIRLVSAVGVSDRLAAELAVTEQLAHLALVNSTGWFVGPLDAVLDALMVGSRQFPVAIDSEC